jgi:hypothetical protein
MHFRVYIPKTLEINKLYEVHATSWNYILGFKRYIQKNLAN